VQPPVFRRNLAGTVLELPRWICEHGCESLAGGAAQKIIGSC
jgi:hypothetical protein